MTIVVSRMAHDIMAQMKMTAVIIKFSIYVFLVKTDYLQKTVTHSWEKKNTLVVFNLEETLHEKLLSFHMYIFSYFYWFQITIFCFYFPTSSFQARMLVRIYVPQYIKRSENILKQREQKGWPICFILQIIL